MIGEQSLDRTRQVVAIVGRTISVIGHPVVLFGGAVAGVLAIMPTITDGFPIGTAAVALVIFAISLLAGRRLSRLLPGIVVVTAGLAGTLGIGLIRSDPYSGPLLITLTVIVPGLIGRSIGQRSQLMAAAADRARLAERGRIAAEMHDLIGHELSLLALRAGALELDDDLPGRYRDTATQLRLGAHTATRRLTEVLTVLRADEPPPLLTDPRTGQPGGLGRPTVRTAIDDLVRRADSAGAAVAVDWRLSVDDLEPTMNRLVSIVVREGLTNAIKHAPGQPIAVIIGAPSGRVTVTVRSPLSIGPTAGVGTGSGLPTLRLTVEAAGGSLRAGPTGEVFELVAEVGEADGGRWGAR